MRWSRIDLSIKFPLVGHVSIPLYRSLNYQKPYIYVFGGWDGSGYSNKGILINPHTLEVLQSNCEESLTDWSGSSRNSQNYSGNSDSALHFKPYHSIASRRKSAGFIMPPNTLSLNKEFGYRILS